MKYILDIDDSKSTFAEEFFKTLTFVKKIRAISSNEITNPDILESIENYENGKVNPTPLNLAELKVMISA